MFRLVNGLNSVWENFETNREICGLLRSGHFLYLRNTKLMINKMRTDVFLSGLMSVFMLMSCNSNVVFEDFESGSLSRWAAEGDAFANVPTVAADDPEVKGYNGEGFLKSLSSSAVQGSLTSEPFTIEKQSRNGITVDMMETLVKQMAEIEGVTETLKRRDQMAWVGAMNNIRSRADEIVRAELIEV